MQSSHTLLTGSGRFVEDELVPGGLHMAVLRSPVAHGIITTLDVSSARGMQDVALVLTAADLASEGVGPIGQRAPLADTDGPFYEPHRPVLASDKVVYVGQPVAAVFAKSRAAAEDALEAVLLDIDSLPAVNDPRTAAEGPLLWPDIPENTAFRWQKGNADETEALIAGAAHVVTCEVAHPRIAISPIETRGVVARYADGCFDLLTPSQGVTSLKAAQSGVLGVDPAQMRVRTGHVGGSFAVKIWPYPEHVLALSAARRTEQAVHWSGSRSEAFIGDAPGRARIDRGTLALDKDGNFLAFRIDALADMGAFLNTAAPSIVTQGALRPFGQVYDIPGQHYRVQAMLTNGPPTDAYRGAGKPESTGTLERLIDLAALQLGRDPVALRRQNLIEQSQLPLATPMGETIDAGDFGDLLDRVMAVGDWQGFARRKADSAGRGLLRGGTASFHLHATGGSVTETSQVRALPDGRIEVRTGAQDSGQGHQEAMARIVAEALDVAVDRIDVLQGDSAWEGIVGGSGGSNLLPVTGPTVHRAAHEMLDRAKEAAAEVLEAAEADIVYGAGAFRIAGTDRAAPLELVAAHMEGQGSDCAAQLTFEGAHTTWPCGASLCEVEIDPETGEIHIDRLITVNDIGRVVHESGALGQVLGAIGQGVGEALMEGMVFDADGQPLNGSLMDYALPRADNLPEIQTDWAPTSSPNALLDAKGVGELLSIGTPVLVVNAVMDALAPLGVRHLDKPLTPVKVWAAIRDARA